MLRLVGLVVVVLFILSLAHGERTGGYADANARAETLVDALTGRLAEGVRALGDVLFGPGPEPRSLAPADLPGQFEAAVRSADSRSRRALAGTVLRACPSLGLACQPVGNRLQNSNDELLPNRRPQWNGQR